MTRPPLLLAVSTFAVVAVAATAAAPGAARGGVVAPGPREPAAWSYPGAVRAGDAGAGDARAGPGGDPAGPGAAGREGVEGSGTMARAGPLALAPSRPMVVPPGQAVVSSGQAAVDDRARWRWPLLPRPPVLRPFRAPLSEYGRGHRGLDLAAVAGAPVLAVEGGVVTHAGVVAGRGTVTVRHTDGLSSTYEPVVPAVGVGVVVTVGGRLGTVDPRAGPGHCGSRVCLHLGARRGEAYVDPFPLLSAGRVRLLPLD